MSHAPSRPERFLRRVGALAAKEALHIRRDVRTLYLALGMPVVMLLLFGYGVSFDIDRIPVLVVDQDQTPASRALARGFLAARELVSATPPSSEGPPPDIAAVEPALREGRALAALVLPHGLGRDLDRGAPVTLQLLVDGADGVVANQVLAKAEAFTRVEAARVLREAGVPLPTAPGAAITLAPALDVQVSTRFNPAGRSALFLVPGLVGYLIAIAAVLLTALAIAGEWERGSMEQLFASPVGRLEIVLGKLVPYLVVGALQLLLVIAVGAWAFDVPIRGSLALLAALGLAFLVGMLGQGLLVSVVTRNQLVATQAGAFSSLLPSMLLSGFLVPIENMPRVLQWISRAIPARYLVHGLRGVLLKGNGLAELWPDLLAETLFAVVVIALATARFRRRLA